MSRVLLCLTLVLGPRHTCVFLPFNLIIWDVGQGSWATWMDPHYCLHFDMGGEWIPSQVRQLCRKKQNQVFLSHEDWDHVRFVRKGFQWWRQFCLVYPGSLKSPGLTQLEKCQSHHPSVEVLFGGEPQKGSNQGSIVYLLLGQVLFPGDSYQAQERKWAQTVNRPVSILILGHHGSHTSSSLALLNQVRPQVAIASARRARYGHPHGKVVRRLGQKKIPTLTTEDWGSLFFSLPSRDSALRTKGP